MREISWRGGVRSARIKVAKREGRRTGRLYPRRVFSCWYGYLTKAWSFYNTLRPHEAGPDRRGGKVPSLRIDAEF